MRVCLLGLSFAAVFTNLNEAYAQEALPKPVAQLAINYHLAGLLADGCNSEILIDTRRSNKMLRSVLANEEGMSVSTHGFRYLAKRVGPELLFGAENVYFEQMKISRFDRRSYCDAAHTAIKDGQPVGQFLKLTDNCFRTGDGSFYCG